MGNPKGDFIWYELLTTDATVDHVQEGVDISIHIAQQLQEGLVARRIATAQTRFCAAPAYLQRAGHPSEPEQLRDHDCLLFRIPYDGRFLRWGFVREGVHFEPQVRVSMSSNDIDALARQGVRASRFHAASTTCIAASAK